MLDYDTYFLAQQKKPGRAIPHPQKTCEKPERAVEITYTGSSAQRIEGENHQRDVV